MHFCEYESCSQPEDASKCEFIGLLLRTLSISCFSILLCFVLALGSRDSGTFIKVLLEKITSCSFQHLRFKGITLFFLCGNIC